MKKEVLIAVISGLVIGLIITLGIYTANRSLEQQKLKKQASSQNLAQSPSSLLAKKSLIVTSHEPNDLVLESEVTLSGIAWPQAAVALMTETDNFLIEADEEGIFTFTFGLLRGFNEIILIASDDSGETFTQNLVLTYSTDDFDLPVTQEIGADQ
jgi:hypothetical protein